MKNSQASVFPSTGNDKDVSENEIIRKLQPVGENETILSAVLQSSLLGEVFETTLDNYPITATYIIYKRF